MLKKKKKTETSNRLSQVFSCLVRGFIVWRTCVLLGVALRWLGHEPHTQGKGSVCQIK